MARGEVPKIAWGAGYANEAVAGYPLVNVTSWTQPVEGSRWERAPSGVVDTWISREDAILEGDWPYIPTTDTGGVTGWDGATGIDAMLSWLRAGNLGRFYPDESQSAYVEFYLLGPQDGPPAREADDTRRIRLRLASADGSAWEGF